MGYVIHAIHMCDIGHTFYNSLLFTEEHSEHYTNLSTLNHNVRFLPCQHRGVT